MKKLTALLLAIAMMVTCTLCAVAEDGKTYMAVCIASEPDTLDPALNSAVDGATMVAHLFAGLSTWAQTDDGKLEILPDCAVELPDPVVNDDGTVTAEHIGEPPISRALEAWRVVFEDMTWRTGTETST
mgnify:CR=1 FL=1